MPGHRDGAGRKAQFYEPGGVSVVGDTIYVADTNNNVVRAVNGKTGETRTVGGQ
jgi:hypothetical protein